MHPSGRRAIEPLVLRTVWLSLIALLCVAVFNRFLPVSAGDLAVAEQAEILEPLPNEPVTLDVTRLVARSSTSVDGEKRLTIWGMIKNPVSSNVDSLTIAVTIWNGATVAATVDGTPAAKAVPSGGVIPFRLVVPAPPKWKATWPLSATAVGKTTDTPIAAMSLTNVSSSTDDARKVHIRGTVHNASDWATGDSLVWVTLLNPAGQVVTASWRSITQVIGPDDAHDVEIVIGPANGWSSIEVGVLDRLLTN